MWDMIALFVFGAAVVLFIGPRLSRAAEELADAIGIAQTIGGLVFLGATTSLPGVIISFDAALGGEATLSVSNAIGGIAAQTVFIVVADAAMRRGPLSREIKMAASLMQLAVLISLLTLIMLAMLAPTGLVLFGVHPVSYLLITAVFAGFRMIQTSEIEPKWYSRRLTAEIRKQVSGKEDDVEVKLTGRLVGRFLVLAALIGGAGWLISFSGQGLIDETGASPMLVGMTGMAIASSLPELVTAVSAVRRGAVALAIGDIIGGNVFDTLIIAVADFAYRDGPIYGGVTVEIPFLTVITVLMSSILLIMFVRRESEALGARIGTESYLILSVYAVGVIYVLL
ncbi:sodium:calcium antiporter [Halalkalicoccus subterraneus]|uniref:sodium:calcium antiporter n=1 Tax=Halalkalicoccus subterraneus TaxID=2675002 RepID=UPI000EFC00F2|nr:sodium:calcium antiporter [Halalkalicoccus subterraneus]